MGESELSKRIKAAIIDIQRDEMYFASDNRTFEFIQKYPDNTDEVLVNEKISAMNNGLIDVHYVPEMADYIIRLGIDDSLDIKDITLVERIAGMDEKEPRKFRKFASRYCNYHHPKNYVVQSEIAEEIMELYVHDPDTPDGLPEDINPYENFKIVTDAFMLEYEFGAFNYYEMEKCLWLKSVPLKRYFTDLSIREGLK